MVDLGTLLALGLTGVTAIVEVIRLEGRIKGHDALFIEREKVVDAHHTELKNRLERIERKLDEMCKLNGSTTH